MSRASILLSILGVLLITVGWYLVLVKPTIEEKAETEILIDTEVDIEFRLTSQRAALRKIEDNMLAYLAALSVIERSIPTSPQTASLIDDLAILAEETGMAWQSGSYGNPTRPEGQVYLEIPLTLTIQGQFFELLGYLYGIADMDRLIRVESISISPTQDDQGFTILNVAVTALAFTSSEIDIPAVDETTDESPPDGTDDESTPTEDESEAAAHVLMAAF